MPDEMTVAKVARRPLKEIWQFEDAHFTRWLSDNIDAVGETVGLELTNVQREVAAGSFRLDLLAEDADGHGVIIENQYGRSDHDHLGKVITYLTAFGATAAIWIVEAARPEHVNAVAWLNQASSGSFYLLKAEAVSIGNSAAGPLLTLVVGPSEESQGLGKLKREWAERHFLRHEFWAQLLERAESVLTLHSGRSPTATPYLSANARLRGLRYVYALRQQETRVELYIDRGDEGENELVFDALMNRQKDIDAAFGEPLDWDSMPGRRGFRIAHQMTSGGYRTDKNAWPTIMDEMIHAMNRLSRAIDPVLATLS